MNIDSRTALSGILTLALGGCGTVDTSPGMITDVRVVINELVPQNQTPDADGNSYDWVELYNPMDRTVVLQGYFLSDNVTKWYKYELPVGSAIGPRGYLVVRADGDTVDPSIMPFGLGADGDRLVFSNPEGKLIDSVDYVTAKANQSFARFPNGSGKFAWCATTTPDTDNGTSCEPATVGATTE